MKRTLCIIMSLVFVLTAAMPVCAYSSAPAVDDTVHYGINQLNPDDFIPFTVNSTERAVLPYDFSGALSGSVYSDFVSHTINAGASALLYVETCTWSPERFNLEVGIYNWSTAENWYVTRSNGQITNQNIRFRNLTAGNYSMYIRNLGSGTISVGYIRYTLT